MVDRAGRGLAADLRRHDPAGGFVHRVLQGGRNARPLASPPRLVVSGFYRYVRNPIYVGFMAVLIGQALLFGSSGLVEYTVVAWCIGAAAVRFYEEPILARKFGAEYQAYRRAVPAWVPARARGLPDRNDRHASGQDNRTPAAAARSSRHARSACHAITIRSTRITTVHVRQA